MLDVLDLDESRLVGGGDPEAHGRQRSLDARADDRLLLALLRAVQQLLPEVVVDRGVRGAARRTRQRHSLRPGAIAPNEQLRRRADERPVAGAHAVREARREDLAQGAEDRRRVVRVGGVHSHLTRQHDLLHVASLDQLHRPAHRALVVLGRRSSRDPRRLDWMRIDQRHRCGLEAGQASLQAVDVHGRACVARTHRRRQRQPGAFAAAQDRELRQHQLHGVEPVPLRRLPTRFGERAAAAENRPRTGGQTDQVVPDLGIAQQRTRLLRRVAEALRAAGRDPAGDAETRQRMAVPIRLLHAEPPLEPSRAEYCRRQIQRGIDLERGRDNRRPPAPNRSLDSPLEGGQ